MSKNILIAAAAALSLGACASPYVATPYDRASASVTTIAIVDDSVPPEPIAFEVASAGSNFGLIGAIVDAGIQASRQDAVKDALEGIGFDAEGLLESRIEAAVEAQGYQVAVLPGSDRERREFLAAYPAAAPGTDAYLDVAIIHYGYLSAGAFQPFRPSVEARVRLVSASDPTQILMENIIVYNTMYPQQGVIVLTPNPAYAFQNREEMLADPQRLAAGIEDAFNQVASTAARLLQ
jgi:hypothetical protein